MTAVATDGQRIGAYEPLGELGRGPSGSRRHRVRKAGHTDELLLHELVPAEGTDRARCVADLRRLMRARSPHVAALRDVFDCPERSSVCVVTERLGGETLRGLIAKGSAALPIDRVVPILAALFDGLGGAHGIVDASGRPDPVVHGDLRPEHTAMVKAGRALIVKLVGFGFAAVPGAAPPAPGYASPEVLRGEAATPASDVFSAGVIAWELLAGRHPFANAEGVLPDAAALAARMRTDEVPPLPAALAQTVPPSLVDLLVELCALDPALRPTAASVRVRLAHALNPLAWARSRLARARAPRTGRGWVAAIVVVALLVGAGGVGIGWVKSGHLALPWRLSAPAKRLAAPPPRPHAPVTTRAAAPDAGTSAAPTGTPTALLVGGVTRLVGTGDRRTIAAALRRRLPALETCYERRLGEAPALAGEMAVAFTVTPSGALREVEIGRNATDDAALAYCVQGQLASVRVSPAPGTEAHAWATFSFARQ